MMDLLATVPYYTAYLSKALLDAGVDLRVGSITYYLDRACFTRYGILLRPGLSDVVGKLDLPRTARRVAKMVELLVNLSALGIEFAFNRPDILHVQYLPLLRTRWPLDMWFVRACQRRGSKVVLTVHDLLPHDTQNTFRRKFLDLYGEVDALICHSETVQRRLEQEFAVQPGKISCIPHGPFFYDLTADPVVHPEERPLKVDADTLLVLWQGIIFPYKGVDILLDAWKLVEQNVPNARLLIAGTGSVEIIQTIRSHVERAGLQRVEMRLAFVSTQELVSMYRAADIVVYPYRAITTSGALATGLALGKTIVASDLPVFRELLVPDVHALLVEPGDPVALSIALTRLLRDTEKRLTMAQRVLEMDFGGRMWVDIAERTRRAYEKL